LIFIGVVASLDISLFSLFSLALFSPVFSLFFSRFLCFLYSSGTSRLSLSQMLFGFWLGTRTALQNGPGLSLDRHRPSPSLSLSISL
jgi:hypothetical protein